ERCGTGDVATDRADVDGGAASLVAGRAFRVEVRIQRLDVQPLERRELGAGDDRVVFTAVDTGTADRRRGAADRVRQIVLDHHVGQVGLEVWRPRAHSGDTGEVTVRV